MTANFYKINAKTIIVPSSNMMFPLNYCLIAGKFVVFITVTCVLQEKKKTFPGGDTDRIWNLIKFVAPHPSIQNLNILSIETLKPLADRSPAMYCWPAAHTGQATCLPLGVSPPSSAGTRCDCTHQEPVSQWFTTETYWWQSTELRIEGTIS